MFNVGDYVIGVSNRYTITGYGVVCEVKQVGGTGLHSDIEVEALMEHPEAIAGAGYRFWVHSESFLPVTLEDTEIQPVVEVVTKPKKEEKVPKALAEAIENIKKAGFTHLKVELEGDIGRDGSRECGDCDGGGRVDCSECDGRGAVETGETVGVHNEEVVAECSDCWGNGVRDCDYCEGRGTLYEFMDEDDCDRFMRDYVSEDVRRRLVYGRFYEDGSVDSEFTFTVHIDDHKDVIEWINAFNALGDEVSGDIDTSGAGMHISLLQGADYPRRSGELDEAGLENFTSEVTKLLPALYFLASSDHASRSMEYRPAGIGSGKYNAISTHDESCLEYRLFETCYKRPEAFYDYLKTIANTLKFYTDPSLKVKALGKRFGFNYGHTLARFYDTPEQLRILNATLKELKPADKTVKKLKQERGVYYTIKSLTREHMEKVRSLRQEYTEYRERHLEAINRPLTDDEQREVDWLMDEHDYTRERAIAQLRGRQPVQSLADFMRRHLVENNYDTMINV